MMIVMMIMLYHDDVFFWVSINALTAATAPKNKKLVNSFIVYCTYLL